METWDAIRARRNVRSYGAEPVPDEQLARIVEAGWRAPSASNRQHWDFVLVTDREQLAELATVWQGAGHIASAPAAIVLVVPEPADDRTRVIDQFDLGQATFAMLVTAADLGIGTGHSSVGDQARARAILGVPDSHIVSFMLGVGYPADRPLRPIVGRLAARSKRSSTTDAGKDSDLTALREFAGPAARQPGLAVVTAPSRQWSSRHIRKEGLLQAYIDR